jgi:transcriptional regulator with XRE-family HTH domain
MFMICSMLALTRLGGVMARGKRAPGMLDVLAGRWLRAFRKSAGISREEFAARAGITFQQMQKYETGTNRIAASRLLQFAEIVERSPGDFLVGAQILHDAREQAGEGFVVDAQVCDLLIDYFQTGADVRGQIAEIVRSGGKRRLEEHRRARYVWQRAAPSPFRKAA